jgi:hypothetical protein
MAQASQRLTVDPCEVGFKPAFPGCQFAGARPVTRIHRAFFTAEDSGQPRWIMKRAQRVIQARLLLRQCGRYVSEGILGQAEMETCATVERSERCNTTLFQTFRRSRSLQLIGVDSSASRVAARCVKSPKSHRRCAVIGFDESALGFACLDRLEKAKPRKHLNLQGFRCRCGGGGVPRGWPPDRGFKDVGYSNPPTDPPMCTQVAV